MNDSTKSDMANRDDEETSSAARKELRRHIFFSGPKESLLDDDDRKHVWLGVQREIERRGYAITVFESFDGGWGHAAREKWSFDSVVEVMRKCVLSSMLPSMPRFCLNWISGSTKSFGDDREGATACGMSATGGFQPDDREELSWPAGLLGSRPVMVDAVADELQPLCAVAAGCDNKVADAGGRSKGEPRQGWRP